MTKLTVVWCMYRKVKCGKAKQLHVFLSTKDENSLTQKHRRLDDVEADTVAKKNEHDEVYTEKHAVSFDSALRDDRVEHYLVPVFTSQYLTQFTRHPPSACSSSSSAAAAPSSLP